jgi:hypothetical protein
LSFLPIRCQGELSSACCGTYGSCAGQSCSVSSCAPRGLRSWSSLRSGSHWR